MYNGYSEPQWKIDERKARIFGKPPAKPLGTAYLQLRHALLSSLLSQVTQACQTLQSANEQLTKGTSANG